MSRQIHLGISTCPNDTFAFHGLLERKIDLRGLKFDVELQDIEQLNHRLFAGEFDVAKASFHSALLLASQIDVLASGSALGYGVGPLLLAAQQGSRPSQTFKTANGARPARVLCPGEHTTATLLYQLFHPGEGNVEQVVFSEIMPALRAGAADFGVCIHEGRFTWREQGLAMVEDLGVAWERATSTPLPLGGIVARRRLGAEVQCAVGAVIRDSLLYGLAHRDETTATMRRYAQEMSDAVMFAHVDLYVNEWTTNLGAVGRTALRILSQKAAEAGILPRGLELQVVGDAVIE